ncbi:MAG: hypothetical protein CMB56_006520 [Methanobacteriota archaeon]|nr:MAG: hypothetical protein CMB56_006520 [Euryarchaeota archaeon]|tara:strand:+ start:380 stop:580 length:201 start_codon:yes stop_codon:yes gene_type:complete
MVGDTITWNNQDQVSHSVVSLDGEFNSGEILAGGNFRMTITETFTVGKIYDYECDLEGFIGSINVM